MSILGLTMVPPTLIGSRRTIAEFRSGWVRDLQTLRRNLATGVTPGELWDPAGEVGRTPFNLAHQGGPDLDMMTSLAGVYDAAAPSLRYVAPHCRRDMSDDKAATTNQGHSERPVRIGKVSCIGYLLFRNGDLVDMFWWVFDKEQLSSSCRSSRKRESLKIISLSAALRSSG